MAARSPYFDRTRTETPSPRSRSDYFAQSPSSFFGCAEALGSITEALGDKASLVRHFCIRKERSSSKVCLECQKVLDPVVALFKDCPTFRRGWNEALAFVPGKESDQRTCWQQMESHLEDCFRHLCDKQCFLRAFAPYRHRYALQRSLTESPDICPKDAHLDGWSCRLVAETRPPRILFQQGGGKLFETASRVLKLSKRRAHETSGADRKRKRRTSPATVLWRYPHLNLETSVRSPLGLLEELFSDDPWRLLLSTIFLNRTSRVQVDDVLFEFLRRWPSPRKLLDASVDEIVDVIRPLGICFRRADGIKHFCRDYVALSEAANKDVFNLKEADVKGLHQCGPYAHDAYRMFILKDWQVDPSDIMLKTYIEYKASLMVTQRRF